MKLLNRLFGYLIIVLFLFLSFHKGFAETEVDKAIELLLKGNVREREYAAEFLGKLKIKKAVPFLKDAMVKDESFLVRLACVSSLNKFGEDYDVELVEKSLRHEDKYVRLKAVNVLQNLSEWKNKEIIFSLFKDKDIEVRRNILITAGKLKIKEAFEPLVLILKDPVPESRESAAISLGSLGDKRAIKPLLETLEDTSSKVVRAAVISLGEIGDEEITMPMIRMLGHKDKSVRYFAINILGKLGDKSGFKAVLGMVNDKDPKVRLGAVNVLGKLKIKEYIPVFKEVLNGETDPSVKLEAAKSLVLMEDYTGYDLIRNEVFNKNTDLKKEAIEILGMIKDKSSISTLKDLFLYPNPEIKETVIWSLGEIKDASTFNFLIKILKEEKGFTIAVIDAIKKLQDKRLIPFLNDFLTDENFLIRRHAAQVLGNFSDNNPEIEKRLVNLLSDDYLEVRQAALATLTKWGKKIDFNLLNIARNNSDPLRITAIAALTELNNKEVIPIIHSLINGDSPTRSKLLLAYQLASFGDYSGKNLIIEAAKSEDYTLRKQAAEYSSRFMDADIFNALSGLIKDNKKEVKLAAAKALGQMFDERAVFALMDNLVVENLYLETEIDNSLVHLQNISIDFLMNVFKDKKSLSKEDVIYMERVSSILVKIGLPSIDKIIKTYEVQDINQKINMTAVLVRIGKDSLRPLVNYWDGNFTQLNNTLVDAITKICMDDTKILIDLLEDEMLQNKAVKLIARFPSNKILDLLIDKLYITSGMTRIKVIECLRGISAVSTDRLIADLNKSDEARQIVIIEVLGEIRSEKAVAPLEKIMAETQNIKIRESAGQAVANIKKTLADMQGSDKSQLDKLKKKRGKISMVEKNFIFTNLGLQDEVNVGMVFKIFDNDNNIVNKLEITEVVGNNTSIGKILGNAKVEVGYALEEEFKEAEVKVTDAEEIKTQLERLKSNDLSVKANAINMLGGKGDETVLPGILYFLEGNGRQKDAGETSGEVEKAWVNIRKSAVWAAGEIEYKLVSKIYQESGEKKDLKDNEKEMLNKITDIFVKLFLNEDSGIRLAAVSNIKRLIPLRDAFGLKNDFILEPLCSLLNDQDNYTQRAVVEALAELKDPKAIPFLVNVWDDDDSAVRGNVAWALEKIGKPALPSLKDALKGNNEEKKRSAVTVLYKLGYKVKRNGNNYEVVE
ncbi:MAG: HEAT repeat domain-containing protein [bacterium]